MIISRSKFDELKVAKMLPSVSMYIPTFRSGESDADRIRWKNAIQEAEDELDKQGYGREIIRKIMLPAHHDLEDHDLWLHMSDGYCAFLSERDQIRLKLPVHFDELVYVSDKYLLSPVLPYFHDRTRFFILLLSSGGVKFFEGNKHSITPIKISDLVPVNAKAYSDDSERNLQFHTVRGDAIFHGEDGKEDYILEQYLRAVNSGLMKMLHDERAPLVLAGSATTLPYYKKISTYQETILEEQITGLDLDVDPVLLHEKSWEIIDRHVLQPNKIDKAQFSALSAEHRTAHELEPILKCARQGRVDQLLIRRDFIKASEKKDHALIDDCIQSVDDQGGFVDFREKKDLPSPDHMMVATLRY